MPYDPSFPVAHSPAASALMRAQLNSIVDLIQTIPVGPQGPQGVPGPAGTSVSGAVVDGTTTLNPGDPATASAFFDGVYVHFSFGIPRGAAGQPGLDGPIGPQGFPGQTGPQGPAFTSFMVDGVTTLEPGQPATVQTSFDGTFVRFAFGIPRGNDGVAGPQGPQGVAGPPFTSFTVDGVTTLEPWQPATVNASFDGTYVRFSFGIPRGNDGPAGPQGEQGQQGVPFTNFIVDGVTTLDPDQPATVTASYDGTYVCLSFGIPRGQDGAQGPQGPPGEVTLTQLQDAIAGTAANTNALATLEITISNPPTQSEVTQVLAKVNELIVALRRV